MAPKLYEHKLHQHTPRNVNHLQREEQQSANFNQRVAVGMTKVFQAMPTFWLITAWIVSWMIVNETVARFDPAPFQLLLALASIPQLPLMVVIMVGQGVLARKQELQAEEQFNTTVKIYHEFEQMKLHVYAQDQELLKHTQMIANLLQQRGSGV